VIDFGLNFASSSQRLINEEHERKLALRKELRYGIGYLDDALGGILPNDLILVGARTGVGKTALAASIAQANFLAGKRVHYFALEAEPKEIERRLKYRALVDAFLVTGREVPAKLSYQAWYRGELDWEFAGLDVEDRLRTEFASLSTFYLEGGEFGLSHLDRAIRAIQDQTDLIILDHLHYVDTHDDNENRGYKAIVKRIRDLSIGLGKPIILVAHLRKRDRQDRSIVPDIEDFMGSSDIVKVATRVIMISRGNGKSGAPSNTVLTYITTPKNRMDGSVTQYTGLLRYNVSLGRYESGYVLGRAAGDKFERIAASELPYWALR